MTAAPASPSATPRPQLSSAAPSGFPVHLTEFIGRDRELGDVGKLLESTRVLTLTGAGGSGKTRLASEVAARASSFYRHVWVDLASLTDGDQIPQQITSALGVAECPGEHPLHCAVQEIGTERALLVLDNCEHVVGACAAVVETLLKACPNLAILATSREALGVASETAWLVPPMVHDEAVRLFIERARAALPTFCLGDGTLPSIREICARLDGIPLAIELAAARARVLSPEQIASRLNDAFRLLSAGNRTALPRHRTLRATMEWSYNLLSQREQVLLRRLAAFAGTFDLGAVEEVCVGEPLVTDDILDSVAGLVDKSLVLMEVGDGEARYRVLETVRQYGRERLSEADELESIERRHAEYYLAILERVAPMLVGGAQSIALIGQLSHDYDNVRAALAWALADAGRAEIALRIVGGMFWFWYAMGHFREARQMADRALALNANVPPLYRGRAYLSSALTALAQGEYQRATEQFHAAIDLLRQAKDEHGVAVAHAKQGAAILLGGDLTAARPVLDKALALTRGWPRGDIAVVFAQFWAAWAAYREGNLERAHELIEDNANTGRAHSLPTSLAHSLVTLSRVHLSMGQVEDACRDQLEGLELEVAIQDGWGIALALDNASFVAASRGRFEDAARIQGGTAAHRERLAVALPVLSPAEDDALNTRLRAELGNRFDAIYKEGRSLGTSEVVAMALAEAARHTAEHRVVFDLGSRPVVTSQAKLRVLALGSLQVYIGDKLVDASAWGSARPRELLVYLLMHPEGRTKEQVGLAFWPDASTAQLRNSFHVTLHRLRKALGGAEWVTLVNDRYRVDAALVAEFDAAVFEKDVKDATRALEKGDAAAAASLERALARYRGDFLDGEPVSDWHVEHRDRLQKLYVEALMQLGGRLEVAERFAKALDVYQRVLVRDELHEDAVLALMRCHVANGERSTALRLYQRFADRMKSELDAEPARELAQFATRLGRGS
jgi:non-specific serine/threonine protein kinase